MNIAVVGPVSPYRSGVAKHTTELARSLVRRADTDVAVLSFKRLYPKILYPGTDDIAPDGQPPDDLRIDWLLDAVDPRTWLKASEKLSRADVSLAVIPSWTFFTAPSLGWVSRACQRSGVEVVGIVHNVADHEDSAWKAKLSHFQLRHADRFVTHNSALAAALAAAVPDRPIAVHPHPIFEQYPEPQHTLPRRAALELLFFGLVRPYKGLDVALHGLSRSGLQDVRLSIVGEFWEGEQRTQSLIDSLSLSGRIELVPRFVPDAEAAEYFARADAVLLPYRSVTGSGVVPVAYHYSRPVIVTNLPGLADVVRDRHTGWIVPPEDPAALGQLLAQVVTREASAAMAPAIAQLRSHMSWASFADAVVTGTVRT